MYLVATVPPNACLKIMEIFERRNVIEAPNSVLLPFIYGPNNYFICLIRLQDIPFSGGFVP